MTETEDRGRMTETERPREIDRKMEREKQNLN